MKIVLNEEVTKVVRPSRITITMREAEAHKLLEQLSDWDVKNNTLTGEPLYKLWKGLDEEIGQR